MDVTANSATLSPYLHRAIVICRVAAARRRDLFLISQSGVRARARARKRRKIEFNENRCKIAQRQGRARFRSNALACAVGILTGGARIFGVFSDYLPGAVCTPARTPGRLILAMRETCPRGRATPELMRSAREVASPEDQPIPAAVAARPLVTLRRTLC